MAHGSWHAGRSRRIATVRGARAPIAVLAATAALGCGASIVGTDPDTGLSLLILRGPISPVEQVGEVNSAPVPGALVEVEDTRGSGDTHASTGPDGRASVLLLPGRYRVSVEKCPRALGLPEPALVTIVRGRLEELALECDTGIR